MRRLILGILVAASALVAVPAPRADAQFWPGYPPMWGGPGMGFPTGMGTITAGGMSSPESCQAAIAQAAYPIANQMVQFTAAANVYPMGPFGRPYVGPSFGYPGINGLLAAPGGNLTLANAVLASSRAGLGAFPPGAFPGAIVNQLAGAPGGLVAPGGLGTGASADLLTIAGIVQAQQANVLAAIDTRQGVLGTRLAAADLNAALTAFPREQASLLKDALEGLTFYRDLACPSNGGSSNGNGGSMSENGNGSGDRQ